LHWRVAWTRAALTLVAAGAVALALVSGGSPIDPRTPTGLPGLPPPFLGTAVVGSGELTAAVDAYGDVVDLRAPGPAGPGLIDNPAERQAAGTVSPETGVIPRVRIGGRRGLPLWRADWVRQRYRRGTNVLVIEAKLASSRATIVYAASGTRLACLTRLRGGGGLSLHSFDPAARTKLQCDDRAARRTIHVAAATDRSWLAQARPLGQEAPRWAIQIYERSLLTLRALTDRHTGAVAAGARDGWAYVWPRDAGAVALAYAVAGYRPQARRVARFLLGLDLSAAARFRGDGSAVPGRAAQGDASAWVGAAAKAVELSPPARSPSWRNRSDYRESGSGDFLANAIANFGPVATFAGSRGLTRLTHSPDSGLDAAAAWAARPFPQSELFPAVRRTLLRLVAGRTRFGITPGESWPGTDPWTAPTAWSAWSLAALAARSQDGAAGNRRAALRLLHGLRRAATPAGELPERVDIETGVARSTTPLAWSHAFVILALHELWP
jgi:hypothetical protein